MNARLPSLTALRGFAVAARHLNFAKAAEELGVTAAAVSFQIRQLEADLGGALFVRKPRGVALTSRGRQLAKGIGGSFETIESAWSNARARPQKRQFRVSAPEGVVEDWLLHAVNASETDMPGLRVIWDVSTKMRNVARGEVDAAIRFTIEPDRSLFCEPLYRAWFTPLMRPDVARHVKRPADLHKIGIIGVEFGIDKSDGPTAWAPWFQAVGARPPKTYAMTCKSSKIAVYMAAKTGLAAIASMPIGPGHAQSGELTAPFETAVVSDSRLWLVCAKGSETTPEFQWFRNLVLKRATQVRAAMAKWNCFHLDGAPLVE